MVGPGGDPLQLFSLRPWLTPQPPAAIVFILWTLHSAQTSCDTFSIHRWDFHLTLSLLTSSHWYIWDATASMVLVSKRIPVCFGFWFVFSQINFLPGCKLFSTQWSMHNMYAASSKSESYPANISLHQCGSKEPRCAFLVWNSDWSADTKQICSSATLRSATVGRRINPPCVELRGLRWLRWRCHSSVITGQCLCLCLASPWSLPATVLKTGVSTILALSLVVQRARNEPDKQSSALLFPSAALDLTKCTLITCDAEMRSRNFVFTRGR